MSIDYALVTRNVSVVVEGDLGWNDEEALKLLIVKDSLSRVVFAHAVPKKEWTTSVLLSISSWMMCHGSDMPKSF